MINNRNASRPCGLLAFVYDAKACHFNVDTGCTELLLRDGRKIPIDCIGVEDALDITMAQRTEPDYHVQTAHELFKVLFSAEKKNTVPQQAKDFVGVKRRQNESGVLQGGTFFLGNHPLKVVVIMMRTTTFQAGFGIKGIMEEPLRQYGFAKYIAIKR